MSEYTRARGCKTTMVSHLPPLLPPTSMSSAVRNKSAPFLLLIVGSCFLFQEELISSSVSSLKGRRGLRTLLRSERLDLADVQMSEGFEEELPIATISPNTKSTTSTTNNNGRGKYKPTDVLQNKDRFQSALIRSLAIENRQDGFFPQLGFTGPGLFPNASAVEVELMAFQDRARRPWYGTQTVTAMEDFSFVISNFPSTISPWTSCPEGILVWFESVDTKVVFSVPAFYLPQQEDQVAETPRENDSDYDEDGGTSQKLIVQTSIVDPGEYRLHIVGFQREGERGNTGDVRPVPGSPWNLRVLPATAPGPAGDTKNDDTRRQEYHATSPATTRIEVPSRTCDLTDLAANEKGRWVECENAGISQEQCLVDGWVYLPNDCQYDIFTTIDGLETSKAIANARQRSSIWIVLVGTSIERGILHAMVDMLSSIGMITDKHGTIDGSISDALFGEVNNDEQGHGSLLKCWGWYDIQIGSIRLSYQDYHNNYIQDEEYRDGALKRWHEILSESPDAVIMGDVNKINHAAIPYNSMIQSVVETQYQGIIIVAPQMERMKTGGIGDSYFCDETFGTEGQATVDSHRSLSGDIRISLDESLQGCHGYCSENTDSLSQNECYEFCSKFRDNVFVADFSTLSWSFTHDAERLMSNSLLSQHYHAYSASESGHPKTMCGSEHSNRQHVLGSVVEMTSQIYLGTILNHLAERSNLATNLYRSKSCNSHPFLLESPNEIDLASRYPFRACFTCPLNTVTPQYTWIPPSSPSQTLTRSKLKNVVEIFQNGIRPNGDIDEKLLGIPRRSRRFMHVPLLCTCTIHVPVTRRQVGILCRSTRT